MSQLVLICGGRGTRWPGRPAGVPKSMIELHGEPLVGRLWRQLAAYSDGPPIVVVAAGDRHVGSYVGDRAIVVEQAAPDGVANAIRLALPRLTGPALVALGDIVIDGTLDSPPDAPALVTWREAPAAVTMRNFGIRAEPRSVVEKPADPTGLLCGLGLYWLTPEVIARFADAPVNPRSGEREITAALAFAMTTTEFALWDFHGRYFNLNTAEDLDEAQRSL